MDQHISLLKEITLLSPKLLPSSSSISQWDPAKASDFLWSQIMTVHCYHQDIIWLAYKMCTDPVP